MGPGGGTAGGRVVACGTPEEIAACPESVTGKYLKEALVSAIISVQERDHMHTGGVE